MASAGAICLAEFLPESNSLLHLDLTSNNLELAGVMALNKGLKSNHVMRCLDLNIPPGDEEMARSVSQLHLQVTKSSNRRAACVRTSSTHA